MSFEELEKKYVTPIKGTFVTKAKRKGRLKVLGGAVIRIGCSQLKNYLM